MKKHQHLIGWLKKKGEYKEAEVEYVGIPIIKQENELKTIKTLTHEDIIRIQAGINTYLKQKEGKEK